MNERVNTFTAETQRTQRRRREFHNDGNILRMNSRAGLPCHAFFGLGFLEDVSRDLNAVTEPFLTENHYNTCFSLGLTPPEKHDLVEYLKSFPLDE